MPITLSELHPAAPACKIYQQYTCRKRSRDHVETALGKPEDRLVIRPRSKSNLLYFSVNLSVSHCCPRFRFDYVRIKTFSQPRKESS